MAYTPPDGANVILEFRAPYTPPDGAEIVLDFLEADAPLAALGMFFVLD